MRERAKDYPISAVKIQIPTFHGLDPLGRLARTEQYFHIHHTSESSKLQLALGSFHWARWWEDRSSDLTWAQFHKQLLRRYAREMTANPYEFLAATKQTGSVEEYISEFETRAARIEGLTDELYLGLFLNEMREDI